MQKRNKCPMDQIFFLILFGCIILSACLSQRATIDATESVSTPMMTPDIEVQSPSTETIITPGQTSMVTPIIDVRFTGTPTMTVQPISEYYRQNGHTCIASGKIRRNRPSQRRKMLLREKPGTSIATPLTVFRFASHPTGPCRNAPSRTRIFFVYNRHKSQTSTSCSTFGSDEIRKILG